MTDVRQQNGFVDEDSPARSVDATVQVQVGKAARIVDRNIGDVRPKRSRTVPEATSTVSLIIPVRNEARNIAWVLEQIADEVDEIILVDGNSTDATLITASHYRPDIKVIPQEGIGKGSALRTGFLAATGDIIVMMDADGSMAPQEIRHYLHFLTNGYDFVKGSRFIVGGGSLDITPIRRLGNRFLLRVFNTLYDAELTDLCYGFCAFHRRYLDLLSLSAPGFEIEAEMVVHAMQGGLRIAEVPSLEMPRRSGKSNLHAIRDGVRVLRTVLRGHDSGLAGYLAQALSRGSDAQLVQAPPAAR
ncbi:glycosyltransferase family 2 protein [Rhodococcus sp. DT1]|jgi:glycosyltransferase involved in cell wall biosynthesis|uniref:glycosyltransferase family 2 protein n=1 Tax=unclassified Rhodococcus (in: high G+C Gram-positive bacteria) TaxID=192944 RepID=UPI0019E883CC|nr:glycosyltransferase family 2 protein [Rhodococcus sp. (in: high G+C Gram-positive bacteria)]MBF0662593.1 glycosyltransferase family 2 protein [Rhodococcus sp. (in: high G+C Gram-positive bacteria)]